MTTNHACLHCGSGIHQDDVCVCSCKLTPGVHIICRKCLSNRQPVSTHNAAWLNPLSRDRIVRMDTTIGRKVFGHAARGNA
jgi:hypothetical protein